MSGQTHSATVTIVNPQGLHMRPAYLFAETAARFKSRIEVVKEDLRIDGKSVLSILTLGAAEGTTVELIGTGPDAADAVASLARLISSGFPGETGDERNGRSVASDAVGN
jgi:phosphocarrier protein HPr